MNREKPERASLMLRLPPDLKAWLAAQSAANASSQNSEIVRSIRERMERQGQSGPQHGEPAPRA